MGELSRAQETPIKDLLAKIPADARLMYNGDGFGMNIPIGSLAAKALAEIERLEAALAKNANAAQYSDLVSDGGLDPRNASDVAAPQDQDAKDAARYRWLRDHASNDWLDSGITDDAVDEAINDKSQWRRKP